MAFIISFEGIEACGKTTQIKLLKEKLESLNHKVFVFKEPGGTKVSEEISKILKNKNLNINPLTELLLFSASRNQLIKENIENLVEGNNIIILDRYIDSTIAYQQYGRGIDPNIIKNIIEISTNNLLPDKTIFLDIPVEESFTRMLKRAKLDRIEKENKEFHQAIKKGFEKINEENKERFIKINGLDKIDKIQNNIFNSIKTLL